MDPVQAAMMRYWTTLGPSPYPDHLLGCQLFVPKWQDFNLAADRDIIAVGPNFATSCFLDNHIITIYNQGSQPSCVAYSESQMKSMQEHIENGASLIFDGNELYVANGGNGNNGVDTRATLTYLQDVGARVLNGTNRYRIGDFAFAPRVPDLFIATIKAAIFTGKPCVLALLLPANFSWDSSGNPTQGYHQVCVYGYDEVYCYIVNSWGGSWGNGGKGRIPWAYIVQQNFLNGFNYAAAVSDVRDDSQGGGGPNPPPNPTDPATLCFQLVNTERAKAGLALLVLDPRLTRAAQKHSEDMAIKNYYSHDDKAGGNPLTRMVTEGIPNNIAWAENIAAGYQDAPSVMTAWMNSPGHRGAILSAGLTHLGIGVARNPSAQYGTYWTQDFAALGSTPPPPPPPEPLKITDVQGTVQGQAIPTIKLGESFTVTVNTLGAGVLTARIGNVQTGVLILPDGKIKVTPGQIGTDTLYLRKEGIEATGPRVAVVSGDGNPPPPPPPPPVGDLVLTVLSRKHGSQRAFWVYVKDKANVYVDAVVTAHYGATEFAQGQSGRNGVPAVFVLNAVSGSVVTFEANGGQLNGRISYLVPSSLGEVGVGQGEVRIE